jgi:hypothetical protein
MNDSSRALVLAAILALGASLPIAAIAQTHPLPQAVLSRGRVDRTPLDPIGRSRHNVFGTIVSLATPRLVLRTRTGRLLAVDATTALRKGSFSAPLFAGKIVLVGGLFDGRRVLHALTITRITRLDAATPPDT